MPGNKDSIKEKFHLQEMTCMNFQHPEYVSRKQTVQRSSALSKIVHFYSLKTIVFKILSQSTSWVGGRNRERGTSRLSTEYGAQQGAPSHNSEMAT